MHFTVYKNENRKKPVRCGEILSPLLLRLFNMERKYPKQDKHEFLMLNIKTVLNSRKMQLSMFLTLDNVKI